MNFTRIQKILLLLAPAVLALCAYANSFNYSFVYDDRFQIVEAAPVLANWQPENLKKLFDRDIWAFFTQQLSWEGKIRSQYYRPLFALLVMINYRIAGLNPIGWHLMAILLHLLAVLLAGQLLIESQRAFGDQNEARIRLLAALAATIFAIHPAQSESVAWISAYVNSLSTIFIFGALIAYLRARRMANWQWLMLGASMYLCALLTKEVAIILPAIIVAYELLIIRAEGRSIDWRGGFINLLPIGLITIGYLAIRVALFGAVRPAASSADFPEVGQITPAINLFTIPAMLMKYLQLLIWPVKLNPMYPIHYVSMPTWANCYFPALLLLLLAGLAIILMIRSPRRQLALIWLAIPLLPILDIRSFKPEDLVHDRYLYLSLIGAGLLFADLLYWLNQRLTINRNQTINRSLAIVTAVLMLFSLAFTIKQNYVWSDEWQIWSAAYESVPDSCTVNLELGRLNDEANHDSEAEHYYENVRQHCPESLTVYYKLGLLYGRNGDLNNAETAFQQMSRLTANPIIRATAFFNLGLVYEKRGDLNHAIESYQTGLTLNPNSKNAAQIQAIISELKSKLTTPASEQP